MNRIFALVFATLFWTVTVAASERVELHWPLCESSGKQVLAQLGVDGEYSDREVSYFDTSDRSLEAAGVILRRRQKGKGAWETTAKVRRIVGQVGQVGGQVGRVGEPSRGDPEPRPGLKCETDCHGVSCAHSCSLTVEGRKFGRDQRQFVEGQTGISVDWAGLRQLGPAAERAWEFKGGKGSSARLADREFDLEADFNGSDWIAMELSLRVDSTESETVYDEVVTWLKRAGIAYCPETGSKTARVIRYFRNSGSQSEG
jgi:hypothetical protein